MKKTLALALFMLPVAAAAQNPIIRDQFTADPTARVFGDRVYLYPSHDILPPAAYPRKDWFCMEDYHVFSSDNLTDWTDHGVIVTQNRVPWVRPDSYSMWAPDCVERNGKYYFYFPSAPREGGGFAVGVAVADRPEGPFIVEPEPIKGINGIDPCVLQASDGNAYIFWGNGRCAKLKENMKELADDTPRETVRWGDREVEMMGVHCLKGLPNRQAEGPFAFEYNGNYYLTYPYVRENTEVLAYAMSRQPMGPYEYKGLIMAEHPNGCWTNHHSIVNYRGQWYLFYHRNHFSPNDDKRRSVCIEKLAFNADGTIQEVKQTLRGVGTNRATERIDIDRYSTASAGVSTAFVDSVNTFSGWYARLPQKNSWLRYDDIDFSMLRDAYLIINVRAWANSRLAITDATTGKMLAEVPVTVMNDMGRFRRDMTGHWMTLTATLKNVPRGVSSLRVKCLGAPIDIDWVQFKNRPDYFAPVAKNAAATQPDDEGFLRRWTLLEPIPQDIRSNTVFTDSWLRTFYDEQLARLPKEQKKRRHYTLDSQQYNVKLFRFAERHGRQLYGNLYWFETVIDCPEELRDVRLAAGSNGASLWWIDGSEVLMLSGDRRMVREDGMSQRLTLGKGRHVLRGSVVNGPGLADFCVRFLDEKGVPVKNIGIGGKTE
jgi:hypothetical protein